MKKLRIAAWIGFALVAGAIFYLTTQTPEATISAANSPGDPASVQPAQESSSIAPKPIRPMCARFPTMLAAVARASGPLTGFAMRKRRRTISAME